MKYLVTNIFFDDTICNVFQMLGVLVILSCHCRTQSRWIQRCLRNVRSDIIRLSNNLGKFIATNTSDCNKYKVMVDYEYDGHQDAFYREDYGEMKLSIKS